MSEQPSSSARAASTGDDELWDLADAFDADGARWPQGNSRPDDVSSKVIDVDHQACILCDRCIRACDDLQSNWVIGRTGKGYGTRIGFDLDGPMGTSSCVECGECVASCPTGALTNKTITVEAKVEKKLDTVDSVCPYCGVGCALTYHVDREANKVVHAEGRAPSANDGRLCVKGRYGFDYTSHPHRLTKPLIRKDAYYPEAAPHRGHAGQERRQASQARLRGLRERARGPSARPRGRRPSTSSPPSSRASATRTATRPSPASGAPSAPTRRLTSSRR